MTEEKTTQVLEAPEKQAPQEEAAYKRRYLGGRESMSYVLFSSSKTFHINQFQTRFVVDVLKIDLAWTAMISFVNGIWDVISDGLLGAVVDKTKTRWGKFRPFLFAFATVGTVFTTLYWMTPLFFDQNPRNLGKAIFWLLLAMMLETFTTVRDISETGLTGAISPNPEDRIRMFTKAELIAPIWQDLPSLAMGLLIDAVNHQIIGISMDSVYIGMGSLTMIACGVLALFFCIFARERISQAREKHSYRDGLRTIIRNKPLLLLLLSETFGGFSSDTWEFNYFIDVLGSQSLRDLIRLPGAPLSFLSYTYIHKARARFSMKALWIVGQHTQDMFSALTFAVGSIGGTFQRVWPMAGLLGLRNFSRMGALSLIKIIPQEITLDALDYAEWRNGYRSEGAIIAARSMITKVVRNLVNSSMTWIMQATGYELGAGFGQQSFEAKYAIFFMSFAVPAALGLLGIIPKLFYDLTGEKREKMYAELTEMRKLRQAGYNELSIEEERETT